MLFQIIYHSRAVHEGSHVTDLDILQEAIEFNSRNNVSGFLLKSYHHFVQVLEGEQSTLARLQQMIAKDHRHSEMVIRFSGTLAKRQFADWSMGYAYSDHFAVPGTAELPPERQRMWVADIQHILLKSAKMHRP